MPPPLPPTPSTHRPPPLKKRNLGRFCTDLLPPAAFLRSHGRGYRNPNPLPAVSRTQWCQTYRQFSLESEANAEYAQVTDKGGGGKVRHGVVQVRGDVLRLRYRRYCCASYVRPVRLASLSMKEAHQIVRGMS